RHDLAVDGAGGAGEGDQGQVAGVEHELDAHEHDDGVASHEDTDGADAEQRGGEDEVVLVAHRSSFPSVCFGAASAAVSCRGGTYSDRLFGSTAPSGSSAGVAVESEVANTPGPGSGPGYLPGAKRSRLACFCPRVAPLRVTCANMRAPTAATVRTPDMTSNGKM